MNKNRISLMRRLEEELKGASPSQCARLTKELVRLRSELMRF